MDNVDFLLDALDNGFGTALMSLSHMGKQKEYIIFAAFCIDADEFGHKLDLTENNSDSDTVIVRLDGRRVFSANTNKDFTLSGFNLFSVLKDCTFSGDILGDI